MDLRALLAVMVGLCAGSFIGLASWRMPRGHSLAFPRSHCPSCGRTLGPAELVPVLSYAALKGRCLKCRSRISPRYVAIEALTGWLFLMAYLRWGMGWEAASHAALFAMLVLVSAVDAERQIIPDAALLWGLGIGLPLKMLVLGAVPALRDGLTGGTIFGGALLFLCIVTRGGIGEGDVKLGFVTGWYLGVGKSLVALGGSFLAGAIVGSILIAAGLKTRKDRIAFGPAMAAASIYSALWGDTLLAWYVWRLFGTTR